jgi:aminoglycoside/choline kinase family phosphotransferase
MAQDSQGSNDAQSDREKRKSNALPPPPPKAIATAIGVTGLTVEWLAGDGSDRCYYRITSPELTSSPSSPNSLVLMQLSGSDAQALKSDGYDWLKIGRSLADQGVFVPKVIATMPEHAALIIEDYGDEMLEGRVFGLAEQDDEAPVRAFYRQCADIIARFLQIPRQADAAWCKRSFDAERFVWELNFFVQKYVFPSARIAFTAAEQRAFEDDAKALATALAANSHYFVHRDFHSRNVMVLKGDKLAIIDFQDARLGPAAYDLVSLCFDSYVPFTAATRAQLFQDCRAVVAKKVPASVVTEIDALWKPMLLQRQLKAIGSFGYLTIDKNRGDYLKYVDPALKTLEEVGVEDARWPFLSGPLLARLRKALG